MDGPLTNHVILHIYACFKQKINLRPRNRGETINTQFLKNYIGFVFMLITLLSNSVMRATGDTKFAGKLLFSWASLTALMDYLFIILPESVPNLASLGKGHLITDISFSFISIFIWFINGLD